MNNIKEILEFRFSQNSFSEKGKNIVPTHVLNLCQSRISILNAIKDKNCNSMIDGKPIKGIREVYFKFVKYSKSNKGYNDKDEFDKRELRTLTYALNYKEHHNNSIFETSNYLQLCFELLDKNWRDSFISGLLDCYLSNWNSSNKDSFVKLSNFLNSKINNYEGSRTLIQTLKSNYKYFDKDKGDLDLGATLAISNHNISEATKFISLPDHWITYPYFSGVINGYFEKSKNRLDTILEDISHALEKHSNSTPATRTNKLIVSKIICNTTSANEIIQNKVKDIAFKLIGDPGITSIWRPFENANQLEISTINKAREILNEWVTRQFINVFFERCINDKRRKRFWLQYSKKITAFKVFGPSHIKGILKKDKRISEYVDGRFHKVESSRDVSAFMFVIGDHKMIEFSDPGYAFYAYKASNKNAPSFEQRNVQSVSLFIDGGMPPLVRNHGYTFYAHSDEGKLSHADTTVTWERKFQEWLIGKVGINV
jgi:hypothetical protein